MDNSSLISGDRCTEDTYNFSSEGLQELRSYLDQQNSSGRPGVEVIVARGGSDAINLSWFSPNDGHNVFFRSLKNISVEFVPREGNATYNLAGTGGLGTISGAPGTRLAIPSSAHLYLRGLTFLEDDVLTVSSGGKLSVVGSYWEPSCGHTPDSTPTINGHVNVQNVGGLEVIPDPPWIGDCGNVVDPGGQAPAWARFSRLTLINGAVVQGGVALTTTSLSISTSVTFEYLSVANGTDFSTSTVTVTKSLIAAGRLTVQRSLTVGAYSWVYDLIVGVPTSNPSPISIQSYNLGDTLTVTHSIRLSTYVTFGSLGVSSCSGNDAVNVLYNYLSLQCDIPSPAPPSSPWSITIQNSLWLNSNFTGNWWGLPSGIPYLILGTGANVIAGNGALYVSWKLVLNGRKQYIPTLGIAGTIEGGAGSVIEVSELALNGNVTVPAPIDVIVRSSIVDLGYSSENGLDHGSFATPSPSVPIVASLNWLTINAGLYFSANATVLANVRIADTGSISATPPAIVTTYCPYSSPPPDPGNFQIRVGGPSSGDYWVYAILDLPAGVNFTGALTIYGFSGGRLSGWPRRLQAKDVVNGLRLRGSADFTNLFLEGSSYLNQSVTVHRQFKADVLLLEVGLIIEDKGSVNYLVVNQSIYVTGSLGVDQVLELYSNIELDELVIGPSTTAAEVVNVRYFYGWEDTCPEPTYPPEPFDVKVHKALTIRRSFRGQDYHVVGSSLGIANGGIHSLSLADQAVVEYLDLNPSSTPVLQIAGIFNLSNATVHVEALIISGDILGVPGGKSKLDLNSLSLRGNVSVGSEVELVLRSPTGTTCTLSPSPQPVETTDGSWLILENRSSLDVLGLTSINLLLVNEEANVKGWELVSIMQNVTFKREPIQMVIYGLALQNATITYDLVILGFLIVQSDSEVRNIILGHDAVTEDSSPGKLRVTHSILLRGDGTFQDLELGPDVTKVDSVGTLSVTRSLNLSGTVSFKRLFLDLPFSSPLPCRQDGMGLLGRAKDSIVIEPYGTLTLATGFVEFDRLTLGTSAIVSGGIRINSSLVVQGSSPPWVEKIALNDVDDVDHFGRVLTVEGGLVRVGKLVLSSGLDRSYVRPLIVRGNVEIESLSSLEREGVSLPDPFIANLFKPKPYDYSGYQNASVYVESGSLRIRSLVATDYVPVIPSGVTIKKLILGPFAATAQYPKIVFGEGRQILFFGFNTPDINVPTSDISGAEDFVYRLSFPNQILGFGSIGTGCHAGISIDPVNVVNGTVNVYFDQSIGEREVGIDWVSSDGSGSIGWVKIVSRNLEPTLEGDVTNATSVPPGVRFYSILTQCRPTVVPPAAESAGSGLSGGAIAGITIGVIAFVGIVAFLVIFFLICRKGGADASV